MPPKKKTAEETKTAAEDYTIQETILLENIYNIRFVDKDGNVFMLDDFRQGGMYILRQIN